MQQAPPPPGPSPSCSSSCHLCWPLLPELDQLSPSVPHSVPQGHTPLKPARGPVITARRIKDGNPHEGPRNVPVHSKHSINAPRFSPGELVCASSKSTGQTSTPGKQDSKMTLVPPSPTPPPREGTWE